MKRRWFAERTTTIARLTIHTEGSRPRGRDQYELAVISVPKFFLPPELPRLRPLAPSTRLRPTSRNLLQPPPELQQLLQAIFDALNNQT